MRRKLKIGMIPVLVLSMAMMFGMTAFATSPSFTPDNEIYIAPGESASRTLTYEIDEDFTFDYIDYDATGLSEDTVYNYDEVTSILTITIGQNESSNGNDDWNKYVSIIFYNSGDPDTQVNRANCYIHVDESTAQLSRRLPNPLPVAKQQRLHPMSR